MVAVRRSVTLGGVVVGINQPALAPHPGLFAKAESPDSFDGLLAPLAVKVFMYLAQMFVGDVRIYLRSGDAGVPEECLH